MLLLRIGGCEEPWPLRVADTYAGCRVQTIEAPGEARGGLVKTMKKKGPYHGQARAMDAVVVGGRGPADESPTKTQTTKRSETNDQTRDDQETICKQKAIRETSKNTVQNEHARTVKKRSNNDQKTIRETIGKSCLHPVFLCFHSEARPNDTSKNGIDGVQVPSWTTAQGQHDCRSAFDAAKHIPSPPWPPMVLRRSATRSVSIRKDVSRRQEKCARLNTRSPLFLISFFIRLCYVFFAVFLQVLCVFPMWISSG